MGLKAGDLTGVDLRRDLDLVLAAAGEAGDPRPLVDALAAADPIALAEVVCGPRSPGGPALVRAALAHVALLERGLSPRGAWGRLVELAGEARPEVLRAAALAHGGAAWLWKLSRAVEGTAFGATVLVAHLADPGWPELCGVAARAGVREGLVEAARRSGRVEPAIVLFELDPGLAVRAAAAAVEADEGERSVALLAAAWGPDADELFLRVVPHLRGRAAAQGLRSRTQGCPNTQRLLRAVLPTLSG